MDTQNAAGYFSFDYRQDVIVAFNFETLRLLTHDVHFKSARGVD